MKHQHINLIHVIIYDIHKQDTYANTPLVPSLRRTLTSYHLHLTIYATLQVGRLRFIDAEGHDQGHTPETMAPRTSGSF